MLKYAIIGIVGGFAIIIAGFLILARYNNSNAEAGPAVPVPITVTATGVSPQTLQIARGKLIELRLNNQSGNARTLKLQSDDVEQLPLESPDVAGHANGVPIPNINMLASDGATAAALVRFTASGSYELRIQLPGDDSTLILATVKVP